MTKKTIIVKMGQQDAEFERIFISGKLLDDTGQTTSAIYGYDEYDQFANDFIAFIQTGYKFLSEQTELSQSEIIAQLKEIHDSAIADILDSGMEDRLQAHDEIEL